MSDAKSIGRGEAVAAVDRALTGAHASSLTPVAHLPLNLEAASPTADVDSPLPAGTVLAVALVSIAVMLAARVLAGTPRRVEQR